VRKQRILIVEDELPVARALLRALNLPHGGGYVVTSSESAEMALEKLNQAKYDLLISDLRLPGMNGLDLIELVHQRFPGMPSVLITAFGSPEVEEQAGRLASAYLPKPFRLSDLIQTVHRILNGE